MLHKVQASRLSMGQLKMHRPSKNCRRTPSNPLVTADLLLLVLVHQKQENFRTICWNAG